MRTIGEMIDDDGEVEANWLRKQTPFGLILKIVFALLLSSLIIGGIGWASGWFNTATQVVSPQNVKEQWKFAYEYDEALDALARNWCTARQVELEAPDSDKSDRTSQRIAQEQLYSKRQAEYDAALRNAFEAKLVKPADVPSQAPTLQENLKELDLSCGE